MTRSADRDRTRTHNPAMERSRQTKPASLIPRGKPPCLADRRQFVHRGRLIRRRCRSWRRRSWRRRARPCPSRSRWLSRPRRRLTRSNGLPRRGCGTARRPRPSRWPSRRCAWSRRRWCPRRPCSRGSTRRSRRHRCFRWTHRPRGRRSSRPHSSRTRPRRSRRTWSTRSCHRTSRRWTSCPRSTRPTSSPRRRSRRRPRPGSRCPRRSRHTRSRRFPRRTTSPRHSSRRPSRASPSRWLRGRWRRRSGRRRRGRCRRGQHDRLRTFPHRPPLRVRPAVQPVVRIRNVLCVRLGFQLRAILRLLLEQRRLPELRQKLSHRLIPVGRLLLQHPLDNLVRILRHVPVKERRCRRRFRHMSDQQVLRSRTFERRLTRQHLKQRDPQTVHVRLKRHRLPHDLFGRHVRPRPLDRRLAPQVLREKRRRLARQRKVNQPHVPALGRQNVVRLDIPVNPSLLVHMLQRQRRQLDHAMGPVLHRSHIGIQQLLDVGGREQLHHEVRPPLFHRQLDVLQDVRVPERRPHGVLMLQADDLGLVGHRLFLQQLHRKVPARIPRRLDAVPDLRMLTARNAVQQLVLVDDELFGRGSQGTPHVGDTIVRGRDPMPDRNPGPAEPSYLTTPPKPPASLHPKTTTPNPSTPAPPKLNPTNHQGTKAPRVAERGRSPSADSFDTKTQRKGRDMGPSATESGLNPRKKPRKTIRRHVEAYVDQGMNAVRRHAPRRTGRKPANQMGQKIHQTQIRQTQRWSRPYGRQVRPFNLPFLRALCVFVSTSTTSPAPHLGTSHQAFQH